MLHRRHKKRLFNALRNSVESSQGAGLHQLDHLHVRGRGRCESARRGLALHRQSDNQGWPRVERAKQAKGGHASAAAETEMVRRMISWPMSMRECVKT